MFQIHRLCKCSPCRSQASTPSQVGANHIILIQVMLCKSCLCLISITWKGELKQAANTDAGLNSLSTCAFFPLDANQLCLFRDADIFSGDKMHKCCDVVRESALWIWDFGWIVSNKKPELEIRVVIQNVVMLQTKCGCVTICCQASTSVSPLCLWSISRDLPIIPKVSNALIV